MKIRNKIFILISIFIIILSIFTTTFASDSQTIDISYYDELIEKLNNRPYFIGRKNGASDFALFAYPCVSHYSSWDFENDDIYFYMNGNTLVCRNATKNQETSHFADYSRNGNTYKTVHSCWAYGGDFFTTEYLNSEAEIYVNTPIYTDINKSEIFFFKKLPTTITIMEIAKVEELPTMIIQIMKMIIPIGLVVLSIGLVIYLIRLVISRMT